LPKVGPSNSLPSFLLSESSHSSTAKTPKLEGAFIRPTSHKVGIDDVTVQVLGWVSKFAEHPVVQIQIGYLPKAQFGLDLGLVDPLDQPLAVNLAPILRLGREISERADDRRPLLSVPGCRH
jgi:hypothetical protein